MQAGWLVGTAALLLLGAAPGAALPNTAPARANPVVAFVSELHASEVYVARADGTAQRRLTNDVVGARWPALSPDGTKVAYARRFAGTWSIVVSGLGGGGARDIAAEAGFTTGFSGYPDWSPDGRQVIFSHQYADGHVAIVEFDLTTGAFHDVTHDAWSDLWPRFSPDGTRIAYAENVGGNGFDILTIGADGSNPTRVTTGPYWEFEPTWSPDGKQIAYSESSSEDIFVVNADGSSPRDVTNSARSDDEEPFWTARGLYFRGTPSGTGQLEFIRPNGTGLRQVTTGVYENSDPSASRDGSRLVFVSGRNARTEVTVQTPTFRALSHGPIDSDPAWSHDHRQLAFAHFRRAGSQDIYVAGADGSHLHNLTGGRGVNWAPAWSPDGKSIAFVRFESFGAQIWLMKSDGTPAAGAHDARRLERPSELVPGRPLDRLQRQTERQLRPLHRGRQNGDGPAADTDAARRAPAGVVSRRGADRLHRGCTGKRHQQRGLRHHSAGRLGTGADHGPRHEQQQRPRLVTRRKHSHLRERGIPRPRHRPLDRAAQGRPGCQVHGVRME